MGYGLVWSDEFNGAVGSAPDSANWNFDLGCSGWGNNELENYTNNPLNAKIISDPNAAGGNALAISAIDTTPGSANYSQVCRYTSARMNTKSKKEFGPAAANSWASFYYVARLRLPYGQGIWPAYWTLGSNSSTVGWPACGEIDTMENIGKAWNGEQGKTYGTLHYKNSNNTAGQTGNFFILPGGQLFRDDYHTFAALISNNQIQFYCDGNLYSAKTPADTGGPWPFNQTQFTILNLAVGGQWPGNPDASTSFPQTMLVDYVRVYQQSLPTPTPVVSSAWRVNCGNGSNYVDSQGTTWLADTNFTGGTPAYSGQFVSGTTPGSGDQFLYQYERGTNALLGDIFTYVFDVPPGGNYQATLKFSENNFSSSGLRAFHVAINGVTVLNNFDIYADTGGAFIGTNKVINNLAPDVNGKLTLQFIRGAAYFPKVDAIQIISFTTPTPTNTPTPCLDALGNTCTFTATPTVTNTPTITWTPTPTNTPPPNSVPVLWPNPFKGGQNTINLRLNLNDKSSVKIQWFTVSYRKVREDVIPQLSPGTTDLTLELKDKWGASLANGLYYLVISSSANRWIQKLVVIR